jgi:hypothetical protein
MKQPAATPLDKAYERDELHHKMTAEDYFLGGPRITLTKSQYARCNGYDIKTGRKKTRKTK